MADDKAPAKAPPPPSKSEDKPAERAPTGGLTEEMADELQALGVNPQLDNRTGRGRPQRWESHAKPQQFPGPEAGHVAEHGQRYKETPPGPPTGDPLGMYSGGPHGRGDRDGPHSADPDGNPDTRNNV